jgi:hypothetical protein
MYTQTPCVNCTDYDDDAASLSDVESVSDSGFGGPLDSTTLDDDSSMARAVTTTDSKGKGKARASNASSIHKSGRPGYVDYRCLSVQTLRDEQNKAVEYVTDMLQLKVSRFTDQTVFSR